jgi:hypothetical protein
MRSRTTAIQLGVMEGLVDLVDIVDIVDGVDGVDGVDPPSLKLRRAGPPLHDFRRCQDAGEANEVMATAK